MLFFFIFLRESNMVLLSFFVVLRCFLAIFGVIIFLTYIRGFSFMGKTSFLWVFEVNIFLPEGKGFNIFKPFSSNPNLWFFLSVSCTFL